MKDEIFKLFFRFFREEKGYEEWTNEEIVGSMNEDDIKEFTEYITKLLNMEA